MLETPRSPLQQPLPCDPNEPCTDIELFAEALLALLGWPLPPGQSSDLTALPWPAAYGLPPAYVCSHQGTRRFMLATVPAGRPDDPGEVGDGTSSDALPARLLRRRAWSAGVPVAVLASVDAIAVYDTRLRPRSQDNPAVAMRLHVPREALNARWGELSEVLSKQAVLSGAFDAFAYGAGKRTPTARQAFLADVKRWRGLLGIPPMQARSVLDAVIFLAMARARSTRTGDITHFVHAADIRQALADALLRATHPWCETLFGDAPTHICRADGVGLRQVVTELFAEDSPYDLAWLPDDILGHIHEAATREARKTDGVYYTPGPVVQHIVRHIMRRLLPGGADARILDPACGAGAFLVEVYRALLDATLAHYLRSDPLENPRLVAVAPGVWRLTFTEKCRILTSHIFGVDIDAHAVAVTKRTLLLAALSGEPQDLPEAGTRAVIGGLPCLDDNIQTGNMLIAPDFGAGDPKVTRDMFAAAKPFDWRQAFAPAAAAGGFDAVVGNPPYGVNFTDAQKAYLKTRCQHQGDRPDSYLLFFELCLREWVRPDGYCGLVIPNPWLTNVKQRPLRRFVLQEASLEQIVHFGCAMFKTKAVVDTQIVLMRRRPPQDNDVHTHWVAACEPSGCIDLASATTLVHEQAAWLQHGDAPINIFVDETRRALAAKIKLQGPPVKSHLRVSVGMKPYQVGKGRPKQTRAMVTGRIYDADAPGGPDYRRYLRGADIRRFVVSPVHERYVRYGPWLAEPRVAANFDAPQKLVLRQTGDRLVAAIDEERRLCMNNMHVLTPLDESVGLDGFLGVFNSRLMNWYYQFINPERGEALAEVKKYHVENLPIPEQATGLAAVGACAKEVARCTHECLATPDAPGILAQATLDAARRRLDQQVYALFALTAEEIAIIEQDPVD